MYTRLHQLCSEIRGELTQAVVASMVGTVQGRISKIESGDASPTPMEEQLYKQVIAHRVRCIESQIAHLQSKIQSLKELEREYSKYVD